MSPLLIFFMQFRSVCVKYPNFLSYLKIKILDHVNKNILRAWIDQIRHICKTTTKILESTCGRLSKWLEDSKNDFL